MTTIWVAYIDWHEDLVVESYEAKETAQQFRLYDRPRSASPVTRVNRRDDLGWKFHLTPEAALRRLHEVLDNKRRWAENSLEGLRQNLTAIEAHPDYTEEDGQRFSVEVFDASEEATP